MLLFPLIGSVQEILVLLKRTVSLRPFFWVPTKKKFWSRIKIVFNYRLLSRDQRADHLWFSLISCLSSHLHWCFVYVSSTVLAPAALLLRLIYTWAACLQCPAEPGFIHFWKHCRSRSAGFWRSHLIRIHIVFDYDWKYMLTTRTLQDKNLRRAAL